MAARSVSEPVAVGVVFATNGAIYGSFAPRIPDFTERLDLSPAGLGWLLFAFGVGGLAGSAVSGRLLQRHSAVLLSAGGAIVAAAGLASGVLVSTVGLVAVLLFVAGCGDGVQDVSMNAAGVTAQRRRARPVMQRLHASWSIGFLGGAIVGAVAAGVGVPITVHVPAATLAAALVAVVFVRWFPPPEPVRPRSRPRMRLSALPWLLGLGTALSAFMEIVPTDWSSLYLREVRGVAPGPDTAGLIAATIAMVAARLAGDHLIERWGMRRVLVTASLSASVGLVAGLATGTFGGAVVGFAILGAGAAFLYPAMFSIAGDHEMGQEAALATVSTFGRAGFLLAPLVIGLTAAQFGLQLAVQIPAIAALLVVLIARAVTPSPRAT